MRIRITVFRIWHYLFKCPTFWHFSEWFTCPDCGCRYPCYWDGGDCKCGTIHICAGCIDSRHKGVEHSYD